MAEESPPMYGQAYRREEEDPPPYHPSAIEQWASRVIKFSSQYNKTGWCAYMALGEPKVYPRYGDITGAWATSVIDANQFIELGYEVPVRPTTLNIYETYCAGAIVAIKGLNELGRWEELWSTQRPSLYHQSRIFSPPLKETSSKISQIRLELNCLLANTWAEIDAVQLVGIRDGAVTPADDSAFFAGMKSLVNNKEFSDVKFKVEGKTLHAHKAILAARCTYFSDMFKGSTPDKIELRLPAIGGDAMMTIFTFIYTNRLPQKLDMESIIQLAKASKVLGISDLLTAATYKLLETLTIENVAAAIISMSEKGNDHLKEICMKFASDHLAEVSKTPAFNRLPQEMLVQIVQTATANMVIGNKTS